MSSETKQNLKTLAVVGSILLALIGIAKAGAYVAVIPERLQVLEQKALRAEADHDLIQRIDERTARIERAVDRLAK